MAVAASLLTPLVPAAFGAGAPAPAGAAPAVVAVAPSITATKKDAFPDPDNDGRAVPGDTITYTVQITNNGTDATGVTYSDTIDGSTTFVPGSITTTPIALNDTYSAVGNVRINVPAGSGLTSNDSDPDGGPIVAVAGTTTSTNGGNVTVNADGSFTYNPPAGFEGADTFTYTIAGATAPSNTATVTVNVAGMIWFIDDSAASGGDGRLTTPFNSIAAFTSGAADDPNDNIFVYSGNYTGGLALLSGQALIGEGSTASLATVTGLTPPSYSDPLPATGGANPVIGGATGITAATNNLIRGVTIANTAGTGITALLFGTLSVADTTVNSTGQALSLDNGQLNATFQAVTSDGSLSPGVFLKNIAVGSVFSGGPTTVNNRFSTGIDLDSVQGSISFGATTVPNQNGAGGDGIRVRNSGATVSFASATISGTHQATPQADANSDGFPETDGDGDAIFLSNNTGSFTVSGGALSNCGNDCVDARASSNIVISNVAISNPGQEVTSGAGFGLGGHGVAAINLTGTNGISGGSVSGFNGGNRNGLYLNSNVSTQTFTVAGTTFQNATGNAGILGTTSGTANVTLTVGGATSNPATNCTFSNILASAVIGATSGTSTLNMTVQNSTFQSAPVDGKTNLTGSTSQTGHGTFNVLNNTFTNVGRTASTGEGVISLAGLGNVSGTTFAANVTGNNISGIGNDTSTCAGGAIRCLGPLNAIVLTVSSAASLPGTIVVDGNTLTDVQQGGLTLDITNTAAGSSAVAAKIINNIFGTTASATSRIGRGAGATIRSGIRVTSSRAGSNVRLSNNNLRNGDGLAGSALNAPGVFLRGSGSGSLSVTMNNNDIETSSTGVAELRADVNATTASLCLDANSNILDAGNGSISLTRSAAGVLNITQASAAALATANGIPAANVSAAAGTGFGASCLPPVASLRQSVSGDQLAAVGAPASNAGRSFGYMALAQAPVASELLPGLDTWRTSLKWLGGNSFHNAASNVALGGTNDTVVRPAREAAPAAPAYAAAPAPLFSGENVNVNIGSLPAGKSMTITFQVTIDTPFSGTQVSNQGTVSGTNFSNVLTDDPDTGALGDPTVTPVGTPPTISCPANITTGTDPGQFSASVAFSVSATGTPAPTVDCKVGATSITSPHTFPVGTTTVQCTATNGIGSPATCSFNVTVNDTQTPTISCPADITTTTSASSCDATVSVGTPTVNDNDPNVTYNGVRSDAQPLNAPYPKGTTTITWTATDTAGNSASCQQTVTVSDATLPVITLNGSSPMTVECHTSFTDPGATATDNCDNSVAVNVAGSVDVNTPGSYTLTYSATDSSGNPAVPVMRTVNVVDTTAPIITLNGASSMSVECHTSFSDPGATASDSCDSSVPVNVSGSVNVNVPGTYTLTYNASDDSGNPATQVTRTVTVVDTIAPVITVNGPNPMTVECHTTFTDPGATASDACDSNVPVTTTGSVNTNVPGTYTLTYNASDDSGNNATPKTRTVIVVDTTAPVITVNSLAPSLWPANHAYVSFNVTDFVTGVSDGCNTSLGVSSVVIEKITSDEAENGNGSGNTLNDIVISGDCKSFQVRAERDAGGNGRVYTVTFAVKDSSGNIGRQTVKIVVQHNPGETPIDSGVNYTVNGSCGP